ncbi:hypothetical protein BH10ACT3_BH10ACT3_01660 [soil metagenome]
MNGAIGAAPDATALHATATDAGGTVDVGVRRGVQDRRRRDQARRRNGWCLATVVVVLAIYVATSLSGGRSLGSLDNPDGFQNLAASAFLNGQLAVAETPPGLLDEPDPYEPAYSGKYPVHDLALYDGKLYTVHGPTPVILSNIPYRLVGLGYLNPNLATLAFAGAGFVAAAYLVRLLRRRFFPELATWAECSLIVAVGLATPVLWLLTIARSYEAAIACGYCLLMVGLVCLLRAVEDPARPRRLLLAAGGLSLAAAVGARPQLVLAVVFVGFTAVVVLRTRVDGEPRSGRWLDVVALAAPYVVVGAALAWFNLVRFGSVAEFGTTYQLAGWNMRTYPQMQVGYVWPNLKEYLFSGPRLEGSWPYVHLILGTFSGDVALHYNEPVAGVLKLFPIIPVGLVIGLASTRRMWLRAKSLCVLSGVTFVVAMLMLASVAVAFNGATMRYSIDFAPLFIVLACVGWAWSYAPTGDRPAHPDRAVVTAPRLLAAVWVLALTMSVVFSLLLVQTPCAGTGSC